MNTLRLQIHVRGAEPVAQGSPKIVSREQHGAVRTAGRTPPKAWEHVSAEELRAAGGDARRALAKDSPRLSDWRSALETAARLQARRSGWEPTPQEPVAVGATFLFTWTTAARRRARRSPFEGLLKATKPDLDKLQRAVGDALQAAGVVEEDSRITWWPAPLRMYHDEPGVELFIRRVTPGVARRILRESGAGPLRSGGPRRSPSASRAGTGRAGAP